MAVKVGRMEGAGPYYGIPLEELDLEWSPEEEVEIERYCEKILKNVAEEEMTPMERFQATMEGKPRDRQLIETWFFPLYAIRTLDSAADALKPIDNYRYPKLLVKSHLATVARYKLDQLTISAISYAEETWGANAKLLEYGHPVTVGDMPIKSVEDLEGLEVADPRKHGMFPQYLWYCREVRRIFNKYGLSKVIPLNISFCGCQVMTATLGMVGLTPFLLALRRNPELCRRAAALASEWSIKYGKAIAEEAKPESMHMCHFLGLFPVKGNEWFAEETAKVGKALAPLGIPMYLGVTLNACIGWLPLMWEKKAVGPGSWIGIAVTGDVDYKPMIDWSVEHDLYTCCGIKSEVVLSGPISLIEEETKKRCEYGKRCRKYVAGAGSSIDYWTPQAYYQATLEACRKYGKY